MIEFTPDEENANFFTCKKCGNLRPEDVKETSRKNDDPLCKECYEKEGVCCYCGSDEQIVPVDYGGDTILMCWVCYNKRRY